MGAVCANLRQGVLDQFFPIAEVSQEAYVQARLSKDSNGTMEAALLYSQPFLRDGAPDVDVKDGSFAQLPSIAGATSVSSNGAGRGFLH